MIGYLSGKILDHSHGKVLLGVGSADSGVIGYSVMVPESDGHVGLVRGDAAEFFVHTHVREDALDLFGFRTAGEKDLFLTLLEVSGIGPKSALGILTGSSPGKLIQAILRADKTYLGSLPGVGKKTAERIVLELSDKIRKKSDAGIYAGVAEADHGSKTGGASARSSGSSGASANPLVRDAVSALVGLGYREADALDRVNRLLDEASPSPQKVEDVIRLALKGFA